MLEVFVDGVFWHGWRVKPVFAEESCSRRQPVRIAYKFDSKREEGCHASTKDGSLATVVSQRTPNLRKPETLEVLGIGRGKVRDAVVPEGEGEAGVDDVAEAGGGLGGPIPERLGDLGFVVAKLPGGVGAEGIAESGRFLGGLGLLEHRWIAELHVEFHQHEAAEQEALLSRCLLLKEPLRGLMVRRIGVRSVKKEVRVG